MNQISLFVDVAPRERQLSPALTIFLDESDTITGAKIVVGNLEASLDESVARRLVTFKRFFGECRCRPSLSEGRQMVMILGEDDCPVHGFESEDIGDEYDHTN